MKAIDYLLYYIMEGDKRRYIASIFVITYNEWTFFINDRV